MENQVEVPLGLFGDRRGGRTCYLLELLGQQERQPHPRNKNPGQDGDLWDLSPSMGHRER